MADDVQPAEGVEAPEGQGAEASDQSSESGLYDLDSVDAELREQLEPHLKAIEGNATKKFQEAADYRKQWEPYEQLGVNEYDPEGLEQLLAFSEMAGQAANAVEQGLEVPPEFEEWFLNVGKQFDLLDTGEGDDEDFDTEDFDEEDLSSEQIEQRLADRVAQEVGPIKEHMARQEQEQLQAQADQIVADQINQIMADNPDLPEGSRDRILRLAYSYEDEPEVTDPLAQGFEDFQAIHGQGGKSLFSQKSSQPAPAEGPGAASTSPERVTSFDEAKKLARERLRQSANA